jgi:hypothetical protein
MTNAEKFYMMMMGQGGSNSTTLTTLRCTRELEYAFITGAGTNYPALVTQTLGGSGTVPESTTSFGWFSWDLGSSNFRIRRGYFKINTSSISAASAASLYIKPDELASTDVQIYLYKYDQSTPGFNFQRYSAIGPAYSGVSTFDGTYYVVPLNATAIADIIANNEVFFMVRGKSDVEVITPTNTSQNGTGVFDDSFIRIWE